MSTNTLIIGAVLLTAGLAGAQEPARSQEQQEFKQQQEMEMKLRQMYEMQAGIVRVPLETKVVKDAPYSAEFVSERVQVLPDGNRIVKRETGRVFRDSEGRTRREQDAEPGRVGHITISDPVTKIAYSLDPETKVAWKTLVDIAVRIRESFDHLSTDPAEVELKRKLEAELSAQKYEQQQKEQEAAARGILRKVKPEWDEKVEQLEPRQVEGVMAEGTRTTRTIPAGAIGNEQPIVTVTEEWRSPELQVLVLTQTMDPRTGESTYKLLNVSRAEPGPSWFEVPPDYTVKETGVRKAAGVMKRKQ